MSDYKVGEIAILCNLVNQYQENGNEVEIIGGLKHTEFYSISTGQHGEGLRYRVLENNGKETVVRPEYLKKLPPKDDTCSWDECEWQPTKTPVEA